MPVTTNPQSVLFKDDFSIVMFETNKYHVFSKHAFLAMDSSMGGFGYGLAKAIFARLQAEAEKSEDPL